MHNYSSPAHWSMIARYRAIGALQIAAALLGVAIMDAASVAYGRQGQGQETLDSPLLAAAKTSADDASAVTSGAAPRSPQNIVRVSARSGCGTVATARCPRGYELVGGGIDMESVESDGDTCRSWSNHINSEFFMHGFMSKPTLRTSAWKCRADNRKVDCYAMCIKRDSSGIRQTKRKRKRIRGQNSGCGDDCETSAYRACPSGYAAIGSGLEITTAWTYRNEPCCDENDVEELKRDFGHYVSGNGARCDANGPDHWGSCYALCVSDSQVANVNVVIKPLSSQSKKAKNGCSSDEDLIGCGFMIDDGGDDRITRIKCKPSAGANTARCRVKAVRKSREFSPRAIDDNKLRCQASCLKF